MSYPVSILAIDPGPELSAYILYANGRVNHHYKCPNKELLSIVRFGYSPGRILAIEMIASYGMPVGREVFETCVWIGRYMQAWGRLTEPTRITRHEIKMHLCRSPRANDATIRQALIDRFGPGKGKAIGTKKAQGPLYGVKGDEWAALAVAVSVDDRLAATRKAVAS